jgi:uncharacterized membrane protein YgcG
MKFLNQNLTFCLFLYLALTATQASFAFQTDPPTAAPPQVDDTTAPPVQAALQTPEQLQQLVAPIALYPDALTAQILAASTYPTQIVVADRWMQDHSSLKGDSLAQEVNKQSWDPSIKALTQFPTVLAYLDKNLTWTSALGDAYVNQQQDVMDAIQVMRQKAIKAGNLKTTQQETVTNQGQTIVIQSASPDVVYVPVYDPWLVYGDPLVVYPGWIPYPGLFIAGPGISFGIGFGTGFFAGFGWGWSHWGADWHGHSVLYNHGPFISHSHTFFNHRSLFRGATNFSHASGFSGSRAVGSLGSRVPVPSRAPAVGHSSAFSSFNRGGVVRGYSSRGQTSIGGGGGNHGGGGGRGHR